MMGTWFETAVYCEETYGVHTDMKEGFFVCPECGEPLYNIDFPFHCWDECPVCGFEFFEEGF
jgi:predicted RNA-binding Zn-ribbon protein involved in translation (DUF1610 family)